MEQSSTYVSEHAPPSTWPSELEAFLSQLQRETILLALSGLLIGSAVLLSTTGWFRETGRGTWYGLAFLVLVLIVWGLRQWSYLAAALVLVAGCLALILLLTTWGSLQLAVFLMVVPAGLAQVPEKSRFTEALLQTVGWCKSDSDWRRTGQRIVEYFDKYGFAGTINDACCVAAALLYGWGDGTLSPAETFERTITIAVQLGYDADCNGATVGSLIGLVLGASLLPEKWTTPLNDTLRTCVAEFGQVSISDMSERSYQLSRMVRSQQKQADKARSLHSLTRVDKGAADVICDATL